MMSDRFKHAVKTALAIVIAYAIALSMDWSKPYWAGYTAATISLMTRGEGVRKGLNRLAGAIVGSLAGFALLAAFIQDRWSFIAALSIFSAICVYLGSGSKRNSYFWQQVGFFGAVIGFDSAFNAGNAFQIGLERTQESATGLIVYTVIGLLLWPRDSRQDLEDAVSGLVATLHQLFDTYVARLRGVDDGQVSAGLRGRVTALQHQAGTLLDAAAVDSWEIDELRPAWRRCQALLADLGETLDRWRVGFVDLEGVNLDVVLPALPVVLDEIAGRFTEIELLLAAQPPTRQPVPMDLEVDQKSLADLSPFERVAVNVTQDRIEQIERTTRALVATISEIRDVGAAIGVSAVSPAPAPSAALDRDRLAEAWRVAVSAWLIFLAVIYIPDMPSGLATVALVTRLVIAEAMSPITSAKNLLGPVVAAIAYTFPVYVFVLPQLSNFSELAVVVFAVAFTIDFVFHRPQQVLWRTLGLYLFLTLIHVTNEQRYSFTTFANAALQWLLVVGFLSVSEYVPVSQRPEQVFLRMIRRFLNSSTVLFSRDWQPTGRSSPWHRVYMAFHRHEVAALPLKLGAWGAALPAAALGSTTPAHVQALVTSLRAFSLRMDAFLRARVAPQSELMVEHLHADLLAWRHGIEALLAGLAADPEAAAEGDLRTRLDAIESRIETAFNAAGETHLSAEEQGNVYRLLGAHRGLSEALVALVGRTAAIDWARLQEARF